MLQDGHVGLWGAYYGRVRNVYRSLKKNGPSIAEFLAESLLALYFARNLLEL